MYKLPSVKTWFTFVIKHNVVTILHKDIMLMQGKRNERTNRAQCANSTKLCNQNIEVFETSSCAKNTFKLFISVQSINQFIKSGKVTVVSTLKKPFKKKNSILINEMEEWNEGMNSSNSKLIFDFLAGNNYPHSPHSQGVWHLLHKFHLYLIIIIICNCVKTFRPVNKQVTLKPCPNLLHKYNEVILFLAAIIILIIFLGLSIILVLG